MGFRANQCRRVPVLIIPTADSDRWQGQVAAGRPIGGRRRRFGGGLAGRGERAAGHL